MIDFQPLNWPPNVNSDGEVNLADLNIVLAAFGKMCP